MIDFRKKILPTLSVIMISVIIAGMLAGFSAPGREGHIKSCFEKRNTIIQDYYNGEQTFDQTKKELSKIETGSTFEDDCEVLSMGRFEETADHQRTTVTVMDVSEITDSYKYKTYMIVTLSEVKKNGVTCTYKEKFHVSSVRTDDNYAICNILCMN